MPTYTIVNSSSGEPEARGLNVTEAADMILRHDGRDYELRSERRRIVDRDENFWTLYGNRLSDKTMRGPCYTRSPGELIGAWAETEEEAWPLIAAQVVTSGWPGHPEAMTDEDYDQMLAEIAAGEARA